MAHRALVTVRVQSDDFDAATEHAALVAGRHDIGAVVSFIGLCRDDAGTLDALELEHYPGMAERKIEAICDEAIARFTLTGATAIHRFGRIAPGENIVLVLAAAAHRHAAFDGAAFIMDYLKTGAPFWKKEHRIDGSDASWVSARDADESARARWTPR